MAPIPRMTRPKPCVGSRAASTSVPTKRAANWDFCSCEAKASKRIPTMRPRCSAKPRPRAMRRLEAALGVMYAYGDGVTQDWALAVDWSRKAADQDNPWAQANYGLYLEQAEQDRPTHPRPLPGIGGPPTMASRWPGSVWGFSTREEVGWSPIPSAPSTFIFRPRGTMIRSGNGLLALAFRNGVGTTPNQAEAVAWLKRASQHGDAEAMYLLSETYAEGSGVARDEQTSRQYLARGSRTWTCLGCRTGWQRLCSGLRSCGSGALAPRCNR